MQKRPLIRALVVLAVIVLALMLGGKAMWNWLLAMHGHGPR
jgi:hypothetical protein